MSSSWTYKGIGSTAGTDLGLIAMRTLTQAEAKDFPLPGRESRWTGTNEPSTVGSYVGIFSGAYAVVDQGFESQLAEAYETFTAGQKPLEREFASILVANLWELYAR